MTAVLQESNENGDRHTGVENVGLSDVPLTLETDPEAMLDPI